MIIRFPYLRGTLLASTLIIPSLPAFARITLAESQAAAGRTYRAVLRVADSCDDAATTALRVELHEGVYVAKPMPKAGWKLETLTGPYTTPFDNHGNGVNEGMREIVWSGGKLEDAWYDEFTFRAAIEVEIAPGTDLTIPVAQDCGIITQNWTATITGTADDSTGDHRHDHAAAGPWTIGDLTVEVPFACATLPNAPVSGGFMTVANDGPIDDRLIAATFRDRGGGGDPRGGDGRRCHAQT
ncbi:hypothetical protein LX81_03229 [Palleronia aestuarii]|uniref:YncI copper-binding domain-containing protein n=1 Tax=Palleronia aestuarii TaxID=568105 RepID=A0A2W7N0M9_9RHOB|nr:DUF1775 domain-containing protein [Palleronia aestuarii]PZX13678.1 hypothetical protein LX81_03229 [Palleronia aestuarii]